MIQSKQALARAFAMGALAVTAGLPLQPAVATNCAWQKGDGKFQDKKHWFNCVPGKDDNVIIGSLLAPDSTATVTITRYSEEFHSLYVGAGSGIDLYGAMLLHGNVFQNSGTLNLIGGVSYFRSYSKNLVISTRGSINLYGGVIGGNITFGAGQTVRGAGTIGTDSNLLWSDGVMQADNPGSELVFQRSIDGAGTYRAVNGAKLHFTADASGDVLVNNGAVQLDGAHFTVAKDYQGSYFGSGNNFDARRTVQGTGQVLAADARQVVSGPALSGNVLQFGAMRVGGKASTSLVVANAGGLTTLRGAVQSRSAPGVAVTNPDFTLAPGGAGHVATLTFSGTTSGEASGQVIDVVNNFSNVDDAHFAVAARVYAPAVARLSAGRVDLGVVRQGSQSPVRAVSVTNAATGTLTDMLTTQAGSLPAGLSVATPGALAAGRSADAVLGLSTSKAGVYSGAIGLDFTSHDAELADLSLGRQYVGFAGTVTERAAASLFKSGGDGTFSGSGDSFLLDLGTLTPGRGASRTDIGLANTNGGFRFSELLGGSFALSGPDAFSFAGGVSLPLPGGASDIGNLLSFDATGLSAGRYTATLTFRGISQYAGLDDLALDPLTLRIQAQVLAVPEPADWALWLVGLAGLGPVLGRHRGPGRKDRPGTGRNARPARAV